MDKGFTEAKTPPKELERLVRQIEQNSELVVELFGQVNSMVERLTGYPNNCVREEDAKPQSPGLFADLNRKVEDSSELIRIMQQRLHAI